MTEIHGTNGAATASTGTEPERWDMWQEAQQTAIRLGERSPTPELIVAILQANLLNDVVEAVQDCTTELKALREMPASSNQTADALRDVADALRQARGARGSGRGPASRMANTPL